MKTILKNAAGIVMMLFFALLFTANSTVYAEESTEDTKISFVSFSEAEGINGTAALEEIFEIMEEESGSESDKPRTIANNDDGKLIVVIDSGHGGKDPGFLGNGLYEKNITLKIAQYLKAELEEYYGVTVYMTRADDTYLSLSERVEKAAQWNADLLVSVHINSSTSSSANGAEICYPNPNYSKSIYEDGKGVAAIIQSKLVGLGLKNRGIFYKNATDGVKYSDGSLTDYYTIIQNSKKSGFPGIIVEHGFISNASDAAKLKQESFLKKLGTADAVGIAEYYSLSKEPPVNTFLFVDVYETAWYCPYIAFVVEEEIMNGVGNNLFAPEKEISRAEFATVLYRIAGSPEVGYSNKFADVSESAYYAAAVSWACQEDVAVIKGYGDGTFGSNDPITRQEMAVMLYRFAKYHGFDTEISAELAGFSDEETVSDFAVEAMKWTVGAGIIQGNSQNRLNPWGNAQRAECAVMLQRFCSLYMPEN